MGSVVSGYSYDIYLSYRHKDNKGDRWVTDFFHALKTDLEATLKEDVSIFFDENPHDALLETHHVDLSIEGKLKCLLFIPVISKTYCDPKGYAWSNEFLPFLSFIKQDSLGPTIQLRNGYVTSRIIPIRIQEISQEDQLMLESTLGGKLRSIDFVFKSPGVNRPLRPDDPKADNINNTLYRDQINKVANAIGDIIGAALRPHAPSNETREIQLPPTKSVLKHPTKKYMLASLFLILLLSSTYISYYYFWRNVPTVAIEKSIAVLPFADMTEGRDHEYLSDGMTEALLSLLAKVPDLKVTARTSAFSFKGKNEDVRSIGQKLGVAHILEGSIQRDEDLIRVTAQLIRVSDGSHVWSESYDRQFIGILKLQDEIALEVVRQLQLKLLDQSPRQDIRPTNSEANNLLMQGSYFFNKYGRTRESASKAKESYKKALLLDSTDARIWSALAEIYYLEAAQGWMDPVDGFNMARHAAEKSTQVDESWPGGYIQLGIIQQALDRNWSAASKSFQRASILRPGDPSPKLQQATLDIVLGNYDQAIPIIKRVIEIDPIATFPHYILGLAYLNSGDLELAISAYKNVLELNPDWSGAHWLLSTIYVVQGKPKVALEELQHEKENRWKEFGLALAYAELNQRPQADTLLHHIETRYGNNCLSIAEIYAWTGKSDKAFEWLERGLVIKDPDIVFIKGDPLLKKLESDTRFPTLLRKLNLPVD